MENTFENYLKPVKDLNDLTLKSMEQMAAVQMRLFQENTKLSTDAMKSATQIKDLDSLQKYLQGQITVAQNLSEKASKDAEEIMKLGQSYAENVQSLVEKSVPKA